MTLPDKPRLWGMDADHNLHPCYNMEEWARAYDWSTHLVDCTGNENICVSTVFLGVDHNFYGEGAPLLFETMVFGGEQDGYQMRWSTYDEAVAGHKVITASVFKLAEVKG